MNILELELSTIISVDAVMIMMDGENGVIVVYNVITPTQAM